MGRAGSIYSNIPSLRPAFRYHASMPGPSQAAGDEPTERREAYYSGRVQGVGFRYSVRHLAGGFRVTGFVRNLPDGRVHLMAEGARDELTKFFTAISGQMGDYIRDMSIDVRPGTGEFKSFEIRY